jgi:hypothetical protein
MAGRRTFFSFHYQHDIWRTCIVRNAGIVDAQAAAGWSDSSLWEEAKRKGDYAVARLIDNGLQSTTVTVVLIGRFTSTRRWVNYEIDRSLARGNGLLGIYINLLKDQNGLADLQGYIPAGLVSNSVPCYYWDREQFGIWVEQAAVRAGHSCLRHSTRYCIYCR